MIRYRRLNLDPFGNFLSAARADKLIGLHREGWKGAPLIPADRLLDGAPILVEAERQAKEFFSGSRKIFDINIEIIGTDFQKKVWKALREIPYGETSTYGALASLVGLAGGARAVAGALARNPLLFIVPCHRIIGLDRRLKGFSAGKELKEYLLARERK